MTDKPDTEQAIFDAALRVFAEKGRDGARMQEIADQAGINKAMLHYYYRTKDRLYEAVLKHTFERYLAAMKASVADDQPLKETVRLFVSRYIAFLRAEPSVVRLFILENLSGAETLGRLFQAAEASEEQFLPLTLERRLAELEPGTGRSQSFLSLLSACVFPFLVQPTLQVVFPQSTSDMQAFDKLRIESITEVFTSYIDQAQRHA